MKIKYKLIISIIIIILIAIVPLAWYILDNQTTEKIQATKQLGKLNAMLLARGSKDTVMNNLVANDIESMKIDSDELLGVFKELKKQGLVFSQIIGIYKKNKDIYRNVLGELKIQNNKSENTSKNTEKIKKDQEQETAKITKVSEKLLKDLKSIKESREVYCKGSKTEICYEFSAIGSVVQGKKKHNLTITRMQFSRSFILAPIKKLRKIILMASGIAIAISLLLGYLMSKFLTKPIDVLSSGVSRYAEGDLDFRVNVKSKDELGVLGQTFNNMASQIKNVIKEIEEHRDTLELKVQERTKDLEEVLKKVQTLKEQQDGDYFLSSLLIKPLMLNWNKSEYVKTDFFLQQKKEFVFRDRQGRLGGDINITGNLRFLVPGSKPMQVVRHTFAINGDAMGKSMQGAGGALVFGTAVNSILARSAGDDKVIRISPKEWLTNTYYELQKIFLSFDGSMLMSCAAALINNLSGEMQYFNAEHPWTVLYRNGKAEFIENKLYLRKLGHPAADEEFEVKQYQLQDKDVIVMGSDGRDDILLVPEDQWVEQSEITKFMQIDEYEFLRRVEETKAVLEDIPKALLKMGRITDDLSLLRIEYSKVQSPTKNEFLSSLEQSKNLIKKSDFIKAEELLAEMKKNNTPFLYPVFHYLLGRAQAGQDKFQESIDSLSKAIKLGFENSNIYKILGNQHFKIKNIQETINLWQQALDRNPDDTKLKENLVKVSKISNAALEKENLQN